MTPINIYIPQERLDRIQSQVRDHRFAPSVDHIQPWAYGVDQEWLKELCQYWWTEYDWRRAEAKINRFNNYASPIEGVKLHYVVKKGSGDNPTPLVILHGWRQPR